MDINLGKLLAAYRFYRERGLLCCGEGRGSQIMTIRDVIFFWNACMTMMWTAVRSLLFLDQEQQYQNCSCCFGVLLNALPPSLFLYDRTVMRDA